jgi:hypothetical protein
MSMLFNVDNANTQLPKESPFQRITVVMFTCLWDAAAEMVCMIPTVLSKQEQHTACFQTGSGLTFDEFGTEHMLHSHRHAVSTHLVQLLRCMAATGMLVAACGMHWCLELHCREWLPFQHMHLA